MNEKQTEDEKRMKNWQLILLIIFGPATIGTIARIFIVIIENLPEILLVIQNFTRNFYQFLLQLMVDHLFWYILFNFFSNWVIGAIIITMGCIVILSEG